MWVQLKRNNNKNEKNYMQLDKILLYLQIVIVN